VNAHRPRRQPLGRAVGPTSVVSERARGGRRPRGPPAVDPRARVVHRPPGPQVGPMELRPLSDQVVVVFGASSSTAASRTTPRPISARWSRSTCSGRSTARWPPAAPACSRQRAGHRLLGDRRARVPPRRGVQRGRARGQRLRRGTAHRAPPRARAGVADRRPARGDRDPVLRARPHPTRCAAVGSAAGLRPGAGGGRHPGRCPAPAAHRRRRGCREGDAAAAAGVPPTPQRPLPGDRLPTAAVAVADAQGAVGLQQPVLAGGRRRRRCEGSSAPPPPLHRCTAAPLHRSTRARSGLPCTMACPGGIRCKPAGCSQRLTARRTPDE